MKRFYPRNNVKTKKKIQTSFSAQMQTIVKLLGGNADVDRIQIIKGDAVKLFGGIGPGLGEAFSWEDSSHIFPIGGQ